MKRLLAGLIGLIVVSCAGAKVKKEIGEREIVERSDDKKPEWVLKKVPKPKEGKIFFRGSRTRAVAYEDGITDARMDAIKGISQLAQTEMFATYERARKELGIPEDDKDVGRVINDGMIAFSETIVKGVVEEEIYWEKYKEYEAGKVGYFYDVYMLVSISERDFRATAESIIEKQLKKAREEKNKKAEDFLNQMREEIRQKRFGGE